MATSKVAATAVTARALAGMVDKAVAGAAKRLSLDVTPENVIHRWDLVGRVLLNAEQAQAFSVDVAAQMTKSGVAAEPAMLIIKKQIIAGFIERGRLTGAQRLL